MNPPVPRQLPTRVRQILGNTGHAETPPRPQSGSPANPQFAATGGIVRPATTVATPNRRAGEEGGEGRRAQGMLA